MSDSTNNTNDNDVSEAEIVDSDKQETSPPVELIPAETEDITTDTSGKALPVLTDAQMKTAVDKINKSAEEGVKKLYIEVGRYILETFFNNDIEIALSHDPNKVSSFRLLKERDDLKVSYGSLITMVRVAAQEKDLLNQKKITENKLKKITYSHQAAMLKEKDIEKKVSLIDKCIKDNLSVRGLNKLLKDDGESVGDKGDKKTTPWNPEFKRLLENLQERVANNTMSTLRKKSLEEILEYINTCLPLIANANKRLTGYRSNILGTLNSKEAGKAGKTNADNAATEGAEEPPGDEETPPGEEPPGDEKESEGGEEKPGDEEPPGDEKESEGEENLEDEGKP